MNDSPVIRSGLAEATVMGTPVLVEDLYTTHSDIVDTPVRSFAQWEEEERNNAPPPLSTNYETRLTDPPHHTYGQDHVNKDQFTSLNKEGYGEPLTLSTSFGAHDMIDLPHVSD